MKWIIAVLILLGVAVGCQDAHRKAVAHHRGIAPWPEPTPEQEYLEGFFDGYRGARPVDLHRRRGGHDSYSQGRRDGYIAGRKTEMQRR